MRPSVTTGITANKSRRTFGRGRSSPQSSGTAPRQSSTRPGSAMPQTIRFHLDEHCPTALAAGLRRRGVDVTTTPEAGLLHASDEEHLAFAQREVRVLFTQDEDFLA